MVDEGRSRGARLRRMGKKEKEEERQRAKALKEAQKKAKKEAKEKAKRAKQEKKEAKEREKAERIARREGWHSQHQARYNLDDQKLDARDTIWVAAAQGNVERLKKYVADGLGIGARDQDGNTALHWSARNGHVECLKWILATGKLDVNMQNRWGMTALHEAVFKRQAKVAEWLVLHGANLHILTEGGISPLEKAFEIDEAMSALLVHRAAYVEENGVMCLNLEQNEAQYKDVATKWGQQTIYVEQGGSGIDSESSTESAVVSGDSIMQPKGLPTRGEPVSRSVRATLSPAELQQQQELLRVQELAANSSMQDSLIQRQLQDMENTGDSTGVVPALRRLTETAQKTAPPLTKVASEEEKMRGSVEGMVRSEIGSSVYDMLELAAKQNEKTPLTGPTVHKDNFAKGLDVMTSSMSQFVQVLVDGVTRGPIHQQGKSSREERNTNLRIALKAIAVALQGLFQVIKPFAMTKLVPMERNAIIKAATELQAAVKNLAQGVRGNCNALPQFHVQAGQQLVVLTQAFVAAVWNLHKAAEFISAADLVEEAKEFSATLRQVVLAAIGKGLEAGVSFADVVSYALKQEARLQTLVNSKMIEIFNSHIQTSFSDVAHSIAKASDGVVRSAEQVYSNPNAPANRKAMGALVRIAAVKLTTLCDLCLKEDINQVVNFINPEVIAKAMNDSCAVLNSTIAKVEDTRKFPLADELSEFRVGGGAEELDEVAKLLEVVRAEVGEVEKLRTAVAPESFDKSAIMISSRMITNCVERMTSIALQVAKESAFTANMELSLMECLRAAAYFSSQLRIIASASALSHPIATDVLLFFSLRFTVQSTVDILHIVATIASATDSAGVDNMIDNLMADFDSSSQVSAVSASPAFKLPNARSQNSVLAMETELQNEMRTIRAPPRGMQPSAVAAPARLQKAQQHLTSPVNVQAANFETIRSGTTLVGQSLSRPSDADNRPGRKGSPSVARVKGKVGAMEAISGPGGAPPHSPTPSHVLARTVCSDGDGGVETVPRRVAEDDIDKLFEELQEDTVKASGAVSSLPSPAPVSQSSVAPPKEAPTAAEVDLDELFVELASESTAPLHVGLATETSVPHTKSTPATDPDPDTMNASAPAAREDLDSLLDELSRENAPPVPTAGRQHHSGALYSHSTQGGEDDLDDLLRSVVSETSGVAANSHMPAMDAQLGVTFSAPHGSSDLDDILGEIVAENTPVALPLSEQIQAPATSVGDDLDDLLGEIQRENSVLHSVSTSVASSVTSQAASQMTGELATAAVAPAAAPAAATSLLGTDELDNLLGELASENVATPESAPGPANMAEDGTSVSAMGKAPTGAGCSTQQVDELDELLGELVSERPAQVVPPAPYTPAASHADVTTAVLEMDAANDVDALLRDVASEIPASIVSSPAVTSPPATDELDDLLGELAAELSPSVESPVVLQTPQGIVHAATASTHMPAVPAADVDELDDLLAELAGDSQPSVSKQREEEGRLLDDERQHEEERKRAEEERERKREEERASKRMEEERLKREETKMREKEERRQRQEEEKKREEEERRKRVEEERRQRAEEEKSKRAEEERKRVEEEERKRKAIEEEERRRKQQERERLQREAAERERLLAIEEKQRKARPEAAGAAVEVANELDELLNELAAPAVMVQRPPAAAEEADDLLELDELLEELDGF